ncbi:MAG: N-acetyltransferase [Acidimicrobiia bacterium]|nr:N-acetyltransferase [Acidimicrobiia bacterium]
MAYRVEALADHDLDGFGCGNRELDDWLVLHARPATGQGTRTYVLVGVESAVVGYFAIAPHYLSREETPGKLGRDAPRKIPAILLAELAPDTLIQGQGLRAGLLVLALGTIVEAARRAGGRTIVVDAMDENARRFYEHHDFGPRPADVRRLVLELSTAAQALGLRWP